MILTSMLLVLLGDSPQSQRVSGDVLAGTKRLEGSGDLSAEMVAGIHKFFDREAIAAAKHREIKWNRDLSSNEAYVRSVAANREHLRKMIGAVDSRVKNPKMEFLSETPERMHIFESKSVKIYDVRWQVLPGVHGEGLLLQPKSPQKFEGKNLFIVALPDADETPEYASILADFSFKKSDGKLFAMGLAAKGWTVLIPTLISRSDRFAGNEALNRFTNQPHREWIYRQSFEMGRHILGYEVEKVQAALDWYAGTCKPGETFFAVGGVGEGALIAMLTGALDTRVEFVSAAYYFGIRDSLWSEPIYRNIFGFLTEFDDVGIARLIYPRLFTVHLPTEKPSYRVASPIPRKFRSGAAPGSWEISAIGAMTEFDRFVADLPRPNNQKIDPSSPGMKIHARESPLDQFHNLWPMPEAIGYPEKGTLATDLRKSFDPEARQLRQVQELTDYTQKLMRDSETIRARKIAGIKAQSADHWNAASAELRREFWENVIGKIQTPHLPLNARSRKILDQPKWTGYEVVLDVWQDVFAWGYLLLPKDLKAGERRPVVVCQHGLEGLPMDTITNDQKSSAYSSYKAFAAKLCDQGFIVFAPHNPYRGEDKFRLIQRKANPLGKSLFSIIIGQHEQILKFLASQPFVDSKRIAFYGLSYGGKTAMRVPAVLDGYCLSICSADFNDWVRKIVTVDSGYSYMFTNEWELPEWNLGNTFNYAEMAALICPRPFMVERGHFDGVAPDEWVAYEYLKVKRLYDRLGIGDLTEMEVFNGPHTINGVGTFEFLHKHLNWRIVPEIQRK